MNPYELKPNLPSCSHPADQRTALAIVDMLNLETHQPVKVLQSYCKSCHRMIVQPAVIVEISGEVGHD